MNHNLVKLGGSRRAIAIKSATYDPTMQAVTLRPVQRLNLHRHFRLTVVGTAPSGVTDTLGNLLDGQETGHPGSNFVTIVSAANLVLTAADHWGKSGVEIRCQFVILARKDELTPDYAFPKRRTDTNNPSWMLECLQLLIFKGDGPMLGF